MSIGKLTALLILFFSNFSFAQTVHGFVIDQETRQPIPYANIGIVNKNVGTVSSENGAFEIQLDVKYDTDSLRFSSIGYDSRTFLIEDFGNGFSSNEITISLAPKPLHCKM